VFITVPITARHLSHPEPDESSPRLIIPLKTAVTAVVTVHIGNSGQQAAVAVRPTSKQTRAVTSNLNFRGFSQQPTCSKCCATALEDVRRHCSHMAQSARYHKSNRPSCKWRQQSVRNAANCAQLPDGRQHNAPFPLHPQATQ
jgi:hypothetical protein